jgi:hypothetical protein
VSPRDNAISKPRNQGAGTESGTKLAREAADGGPWNTNKGRKLRPISDRSQEEFLAGLARGLTVKAAAEQAGKPHPKRFYELRLKDAEFAAAWDEALEQGTQQLEEELRRRAIEGWDETLREYRNGELVRETVTRRYSPSLLIFMLKARRPDVYRDNVQVTASGEVTFVLDSLLERARTLEAPSADVELGPGDVIEDADERTVDG